MRPLIAAAVLALAGLLAVAPAQARKVGNPGTFTATIPGGTFRIGDLSFDLATIEPDPTLTGTIAANGDINFPTSGMNFPPLTFDYDGSPITVRLQPTHAWTGNINPMQNAGVTGAASLRARFKIKIEGTASGVSLGGSCYIGGDSNPVDVNPAITGTTTPPAPNTPISGTPYNASNSEVRMVNNSLAISQTASGCGPLGLANGPLNDALGLPSAAGRNEVQLQARINPVVQKGVQAAFTATPSTGPAPHATTLNASGTFAPAGVRTCATPLPSTPNCGYRWDFDGNGSIDQVTNTPSVTTTYTNPGTYAARLVVFDVDQDQDETTRTITVSERPDLTISKSHSGNFRTGTQGTYTIGVNNIGGPTTGTTTVTDVLPAGLSYISASGSGWSCAGPGNVVTCTRSATIAASSAAPNITLNVAVGDAARPAVTNTAAVATPVETAVANNSASDPTTVDAVDVAIDKSHAGTLLLGPKAGSAAYGKASVKLEAGTPGSVQVKLTKKAAKALAKKGKLKAVATFGATQAKLKLTGAKKKR